MGGKQKTRGCHRSYTSKQWLAHEQHTESQKTKTMNMTGQNNRKKYIIFTYRDPAICMITKLFRNTELKIAYKTMNTLRNHLKTNKKTTNKYELCGVYGLKCCDCPHTTCEIVINWIAKQNCAFSGITHHIWCSEVVKYPNTPQYIYRTDWMTV
jgi:hypothetical protein